MRRHSFIWGRTAHCQCTAIRRNGWLLLEGKRKRDQKHGNARGETGGFRITIIMMQEIRSEEE